MTMRHDQRRVSQILPILMLLLVSSAFAADAEQALVDRVSAIVADNCAACHDWARSPSEFVRLVVPGKPGESPLFTSVKDDAMPMGGALSPADKKAIEDWILAGARLPEGGAVTGKGFPLASQDALPRPYSPVRTHRVTGYLSAGLLLAAGAVGTWRLVDLMQKGHDYRDAIGFPEEGGNETLRSGEIAGLWADPQGQAVRWTHVALLASGSALYLYNASTGIGMLTPKDPTLTKRDLHRWAFYAHLGMMTSEVVLGIVTTDALRRGDHELVSTLGPVHAVIGIAAPLTMLGSGLIFSLKL
jgi:hypothetical protein